MTQNKLKIGWFSFSCCEDSTIVFTELLNDHFKAWSKLIEFKHIRVLKNNNSYDDIDVAFVEGAIATDRDADELKKIRKNSKKLVAIGSCSINGMPSAQRNNFNPQQKKEIEFLLKRFHHADKVKTLKEVVKVDDRVPGCPMNENLFLKAVDKYLKLFKVI